MSKSIDDISKEEITSALKPLDRLKQSGESFEQKKKAFLKKYGDFNITTSNGETIDLEGIFDAIDSCINSGKKLLHNPTPKVDSLKELETSLVKSQNTLYKLYSEGPKLIKGPDEIVKDANRLFASTHESLKKLYASQIIQDAAFLESLSLQSQLLDVSLQSVMLQFKDKLEESGYQKPKEYASADDGKEAPEESSLVVEKYKDIIELATAGKNEFMTLAQESGAIAKRTEDKVKTMKKQGLIK